MKFHLSTVAMVALLLSVAATGAILAESNSGSELDNLDFEAGVPGEVPPGWFLPKVVADKGYVARLVDQRPESGARSALIAFEGSERGANDFGNLMRSFDATPYRGKRVRFSAAVRAEVDEWSRAQLWLRVDRPNRQRGFFDNMGDRPITTADWAHYAIEGDVAVDANRINFGLMLIGEGKTWLDSVSFEVVGEAGEAAATPLRNLDFEAGTPGRVPTGWFAPDVARRGGYVARTVEGDVAEGQRSALVALEGESKEKNTFGNLMRSFDATPYRGQRVRLSAAIKAEGRAQMWLRVDRQTGQTGFFDNMGDRPILSREWQRYQIVGEVAEDATNVNFGLMLVGGGRAWIDDVSFEPLGDSRIGLEPPRPLVGRALANLVAFTRLLGYVRYFHPSDEAAAADWDALALAGVEAIESAASAEELAARLETFFRPVAPTVRVSAAASKPEPPAALRSPPGEAARRVAWLHHGVGDDQQQTYQSRRIDDREQLPEMPGQLTSFVAAGDHRGRRVRLRASVRSEMIGSGHADLWLKTFSGEVLGGMPDLGPGHAITGDGWRTIELEAAVEQGDAWIGFGVSLYPPGRVFIDQLTLLAVTGETETVIEHVDAYQATEASESQPFTWSLSSLEERRGFHLEASEDRPRRGLRSALFSWQAPQSDLADPGEPFEAELGGGVVAWIPLALYADAAGTLPRVGGRVPVAGKPQGFLPSGDDRSTRLADVALAWNVFQHFYPYFDVVESDWPGALEQALTAAATDTGEAAFHDTLRRLVAKLDDGHGNVYHSAGRWHSTLPIRWDWIEAQLVVTQVDSAKAAGLRLGDTVLRINGRPAGETLDAIEKRISGATPQWRRIAAVRELATGPISDEVVLDVESLEGVRRTVTLHRVFGAYGSGNMQEERPEKITEIQPGFFYLDLSRISDEDFRHTLEDLSQANGIVFDLRGYPAKLSTELLAHLTEVPISSARWNIPVLTRPDRHEMTFERSGWWIQPREPRLTAPAAFLTDGRAISYAETYLAIVEHYRLADIVGSATAGTNGNVNQFRLPGGYQVSWTGMKVLKHDGSRHHGVGILPTVSATPTRRGVASGRDEVLERALVHLGATLPTDGAS